MTNVHPPACGCGPDPARAPDSPHEAGHSHPGGHDHDHAHAAQPGWPTLAFSGAAALAAEIAYWMDAPWMVPAALAILAVLASGLGAYREGWSAVRHGRLDINALMSIAVTGALILGQWAEAAMVMVLFTLAERIEAHSLDRARHAVQDLMQLAPDRARVQQADGGWDDLAARDVPVGATVRVLPGERIALDGEVLSGESTVDQSPITGESLPVDKAQGDPVYAGTINTTGVLDYRVSLAARDSTLARIIQSIETAQASRAPTQRFVDRFARVYTPLVVGLAALIAVVPPLAGLGGWQEWIYKALVLLVIACPCALVISTPVSIVSGLAAAARHGILVKGGAHLEQGYRLRWLALDKTGTVTQGHPTLNHSEPLGNLDASQCHALAAGLASQSDHPVSQAIAQGLNVSGAIPPIQLQALPGRGIQGVIEGRAYLLGNHRLIHERGLCSPTLEARLETLERQGRTVVLLSDTESVLALYTVADAVKPESAAAIRELHDLGIQTAILSGDNPHTVAAIAREVGVTRAEGNLLPEDKLLAVQRLADTGATVGMVGDGINDAPALARADIGFAMGAMGTDAAIETADVALMDDDLRKIPWFIRLSRATHRVLIQNITLALGLKLAILILTVAGLGTLWLAVLADVGASLLVVGNGLRLLRPSQSPASRATGAAAHSLAA
ncbi:Cd2+/Zn2+-exporting ATPase OS=Castellaniella defragrans OX=75697 GN=HNR28_000757 PE=3 SV=1 [Castellaniella defragrans]